MLQFPPESSGQSLNTFVDHSRESQIKGVQWNYEGTRSYVPMYIYGISYTYIHMAYLPISFKFRRCYHIR